MNQERVAVGRFATLDDAEFARQRLSDAGLLCSVASTRARADADPNGYALIVNRADAVRAASLLLPEERVSAAVTHEGEKVIRVALGLVAVLLTIGLVIGLFRR
jgi:hypothetical protein